MAAKTIPASPSCLSVLNKGAMEMMLKKSLTYQEQWWSHFTYAHDHHNTRWVNTQSRFCVLLWSFPQAPSNVTFQSLPNSFWHKRGQGKWYNQDHSQSIMWLSSLSLTHGNEFTQVLFHNSGQHLLTGHHMAFNSSVRFPLWHIIYLHDTGQLNNWTSPFSIIK